MIAHNYVNLRRIRYYFHYCAISYQRDNRDVSHVKEHGSLKLIIPTERPLFSKADVKEHPFRLSLDVCFRPKGDIRIFWNSCIKAHPLTVNTSALAPESGH